MNTKSKWLNSFLLAMAIFTACTSVTFYFTDLGIEKLSTHHPELSLVMIGIASVCGWIWAQLREV